ncbi:probable protein phosphatase 2C 47 isoform X1 [Primulina eburnea]|uniref:probable protein phosphatase 2C 47 isoform X1 n=1 Tax=Primulina eburnea TaxID=1245227 RepID=UPI003C6C7DBA
MAGGASSSSCQAKLENGFCKENQKMSDFEKKKIQENHDEGGQAVVALPPVMRHCISHETLANTFSLKHTTEFGLKPPSGKASLPMYRSGSCSEIGPKTFMEDEYICVDNLHEHLGTANGFPSPGAFYGVFDGHGGVGAASFARKNILNFIIEDLHFPDGVDRAIQNAFVKADNALADASNIDRSSGTTALTAIMLGRTMVIANAGDSRAVLGKRGRAIELSKDHKPNCTSEKLRIEKLGGVIYDGYLNGQLSVARALGDWHMKGAKGTKCPLSSEPEIEEVNLTEEDEFLIIGCDGLWDVMSSQYAVTVVRKALMMHNDPGKCSRELVREALSRNTCDNLTVVVVCFSPDPPPRIEIPKSQKRRSISAEGLDLLKGVLNDV